MENYGLVGVSIIVFVFCCLYSQTAGIFSSQANITTTIGNSSVVALAALATVIPFRAGFLDLSVSASIGIASVMTAAGMAHFGLPLWGAIGLGLLSGILVGALNGFLVTVAKLDVFITTLGMATFLSGILQWYTGGMPITTGLSLALQDFGSLTWWGIPRLVFLLIPVIAIAWYLLEHTPFGRELTAIGSNARAAHMVGIGTKRVIWTSFLLSGAIAGIAGVLLTARSGGADPLTGPGLMFPVLAAVFLGKTTIRPGQANVPGTIIGVLFVAFTVSGLSIAGAQAWVGPVFNGVALVGAIALATYFGRRRTPA
ncbi:ABC transporter permease [Paeniglutamicibacter sp.]|uniref:ABC transporter permease n=1 Tax=Paeniglutamicibacter sp. TaxID=1934391 RepID=UPI003989C734